MARTHPLFILFVAYNLLFWLPIVLVIVGAIDYRTGAIGILVITAFRAMANAYRTNFLTLEQAEVYPFRIP